MMVQDQVDGRRETEALATHLGTMSCDITLRAGQDSNLRPAD
jgi:hypothetical protein